MAIAKIIYCSMTGNTEEIADIIDENLENLDVDVNIQEGFDAEPEDFEDADICIVATYTYDDGVVPDDIIDFYEDLADVDLTGKIFGVAGSGDTFYEFFCKAVDDFEAQFEKTGAIKGADSVKVELAPEAEDIENLDKFCKDLVNKYNELHHDELV